MGGGSVGHIFPVQGLPHCMHGSPETITTLGLTQRLNPKPIELVMLLLELEVEEEVVEVEEEEEEVEWGKDRYCREMGNRRGKSFFQSRCVRRQGVGDWEVERVERCDLLSHVSAILQE